MKIVLDECIPIRLRFQFSEYECVTAEYLQAKGLKDGPLLEKVAPDADVFITVDTNIRSQQNFERYPQLAVIYLTGKDTDLDTLVELVPEIKKVLRSIKPGQQVRIPS